MTTRVNPNDPAYWTIETITPLRDGKTTDEGHDTPDAPPSDPINPDHYKVGGAEVIDIVEHLPYNAGNAIKYLARAGRKDPTKHIEDLKKSAWYVARELERIEGDHS